MADELDPVTQTFEADVAEYVAAVEEAAAQAQEFAAANEEAKVAVDGLRDSSAEAGAAVASANDAAGMSASELRDRLAEVAAAAGLTRDEMGKLRDAQGKFVGDSVLTGLALGHERDEALEAAAAFKKLRDAVAEADIAKSGGLLSGLSGLFGGGGGGGGGGSSALSGIPLIGTLIESPELIGAVVLAVAGIATELTALATGFTAAGLGIGGFAALALPAFKSVTTAYGQINTDQQAYNRALTATAKNTALQHLKQDYANLDPAQRGAVQGIQQLVGEYHKLSKAFEPTAFKVFNEGLKIANQLLPYVGQFANAAAPAIEKLLGGLSKAIDSPSFKKFMDFLSSLAGPAITAIGSGMAGLAKDVMQLFTVMSQKDVINGINIAFRLIGFALTAVIDTVKYTMWGWDNLVKVLHDIAGAFDVTRHAIATAGHAIADAFDTVRHAVATAGHEIASAFDTVRHAVATFGHDFVAALDAVVNWVKSNWKDILGWLLLPVLMAAGEIYTHTHQIAQAFDELRHSVAAILDGMRHDIAAVWDGMRHDVAAIVDATGKDIEKAWDTIRHAVAATVDAIPGNVEKAWDTVRHDAAAAFDALVKSVSTMITDVLGFFQRLPGQITGFLARLPGDMLSIGQNMIHGLINGIESMGGTLANAIVSLIPSPIRSLVAGALGILSPSTVFHGYGVNIVQGLINGVQSMQPHLRTAMTGLTGGVTGIGSSLAAGAIGAAGGSSSVHVTVPVTVQGGTAGVSPQYLQSLQATVQEAVLRHAQMNPGNGLTPAWGR